MPTYITLLRFTQKGIENIKESPSRLAQAKQAMAGCRRRDEGFLPHSGCL